MLSFGAEVRQEKSLDDAKNTLLEVIEDIKKNPPTEEEVSRARIRLLKNFELSLKRSDQIGLRLSESIALGDWRLAFLDRDRLEKVTPADVARVVSAYLKASNRTIGLFIPEQNADRAVTPPPPESSRC
jgi:zinc protease